MNTKFKIHTNTWGQSDKVKQLWNYRETSIMKLKLDSPCTYNSES